MNGYNFTMRVRKVLAFAREEAVRLRHPYVGTEHELLGLLREGDGIAVTALTNLNADVDAIRQRLESSIKSGQSKPVGPDLPYTSRAKKALELAMSEARELNHAYVGTEHLLLGLIREEKGIAAQVLVDSGLTLEVTREEIRRILGPGPDAGNRLGETRRQSDLFGFIGVSSGTVPGRVGKVLSDARDVAARFGAPRVAATHAAIALLAHGEGTACAALERMGCDLGELARALEPSVEPIAPAASAVVVPLAPDLERALVAAQQEQRQWRSLGLATHHLLLALLETCPTVAAPFNVRGVTVERLRVEAARLID